MVSLFTWIAPLTFACRDSEESAPAEYPPDQPEADNLDDDSNAYGAEEAELEAALVKELEDANKEGEPDAGEDHEMEGAEPTTGKEDEDESDAGSEDLEEDSDDDDDDELDEEDGGDEDVEMGDDSEQKDDPAGKTTHPAQPEVMVH